MPVKKVKNSTFAKASVDKQKSKIKTTIQKSKIVAKTVAKKSIKKETVQATAKIAVPRSTGLNADVLDLKGKVVEKMTLPKEIFGAKINDKLMAQAVRVYLANQRSGTASTKTRGEVTGSSRKIYRQKGTGRARHGSVRAPIFVKGGVVFGPKPRDYSLDFPKKMKRAALFSALSSRLKTGEIKILKGLTKIEPKTKEVSGIFKNLSFKEGKKVLLVTPKETQNVWRASRNIEGVNLILANQLNTYEALKYGVLLFMQESIKVLEDQFLKKE